MLIASQPTRGVDIRGIGYIHELLRRSRDEGTAIVLFSEELDELRTLADRIVVMHRGTVSGEFSGRIVAGGGDFIDTADSYSAWVPGNEGGESETIIGEWLASRKPAGVVVATSECTSS